MVDCVWPRALHLLTSFKALIGHMIVTCAFASFRLIECETTRLQVVSALGCGLEYNRFVSRKGRSK